MIHLLLERIAASRPFAGSPRLRCFLRFVVEKALAGEGGDIKEFVIATEVYGRSSEYDPQVDSTVRVEASRLRSKLRQYYETEGAADVVRIELPKGSYVPAFVTTENRQQDAPEPARSTRWRYSAATVAILLSCAALAGIRVAIRAQRPVRTISVAPFVQLTSGESTSGLAEGLRRVAQQVAESVSSGVISQDSRDVQDSEAEQMYLAADRLLRHRVLRDGWPGKIPPTVLESVALFEHVTRIAPRYARGWVGLAEAQEWAYELDKSEPAWRIGEAEKALRHALEVDPNLPEAHSRLASLYFHRHQDLDRAETALRRAIELNPRDVRSQARYADLLRVQGRMPEALREVTRALTIDPASGRLWAQQAILLYDLRRYDEAIGAASHSLEVNTGKQMPQYSMAVWIRGLSYQEKGDLQAAEANFRQGLEAYPEDGWNQPSLAFVLARTGRAAQARGILADLMRQNERGKHVAVPIALVLLALGEHQAAIEWLEHGRERKDTGLPFIRSERRFEALHGNTRFQRLLTSVS